MKSADLALSAIMVILLAMIAPWNVRSQTESKADHDVRMHWWREARFGLFIHWGLYAIPAGEWKGKTEYGEWIRTSAEIPLEEYDKFVQHFNPGRFDADQWVRLAKEAGMKYIVITSKHHDGFCLFNSRYTDFDVMSTPFKRDILDELAQACRKHGLKMCWYHSIMDWHHPDYLPRREWENDRSTEGANFDRYVQHMKDQICELLTKYGDIGVLWFDGEWESTWNTTYGRDLYEFVRKLQPNIIVNNRVGAGRSGMEGLTKEGEFGGDFGTPEQQIPATGLPGVDWETCMTMNDHWGYNKHDQHWKSTRELLQMLADIASKGGNYLLNVGPTSEGVFPQASIERLKEIGQWMNVNGESIHGTEASPFKNLAWGRCTRKTLPGGTRLYLHVFDWPASGQLIIPGIFNRPDKAWLLADRNAADLKVVRQEDALSITVPRIPPDPVNSVVVLDLVGKADVNDPPIFQNVFSSFVDSMDVRVGTDRENTQVAYTLDGRIPDATAPLVQGSIAITKTTTVSARCFRNGQPVSGTMQATFTKVHGRPAINAGPLKPGIRYMYFEGDWDALPDFHALKPVQEGILPEINFSPRKQVDHFGFEYTGLLRIDEDDVYAFFTDSDDGSRLYIGDSLIVENDGLHSMQERRGDIALARGLHRVRVKFFEKTGNEGLTVSIMSRRMKKQPIPSTMLFCGE